VNVKTSAPVRIAVVGHVDHGKSTFIGRLFHDTGALPEGRLEQLRSACDRRGVPLEWAFLTDGLQVERDQNVTVDAAHIWLRTGGRCYALIDTPGHKEFLRNMLTGAAGADAALLVVDAAEGVQEQTQQHARLLQWLGIRQLAVLVNKMDLCGYREEAFRHIAAQYPEHLVIPICARTGENLVSRSANLSWYTGPTALEAMAGFHVADDPVQRPLRLPVQDVYRFDGRRIIVGRIVSGSLRVGDRILFSPRGRFSVVETIEGRSEARAGESVGITLAEAVFVERGQMISHEQEPPIVADNFGAILFWLGRQPLQVGQRLKLKLATQETDCRIESIGATMEEGCTEVTIRTRRPVVFDLHDRIAATGRFVLVDQYRMSGGGVIVRAEQQNLFWTKMEVSRADRERRNQHKGTVVWLTGLPASGKSTIATALERELFRMGAHTYVLDGDNIRHGLSANLGFSPEDRAENIRRVAEVAKLFCDAGLIVIVAFISPYREDRRLARSLVEEGDFVEVFVHAPLAVCEQRDRKGLYARARAGEIAHFTGISAPYEPPEHPEIILDTERHTPAECVEQILRYLQDNGRIPRG